MSGGFLERPALIPSKQWTLEGLSHRGEKAPPVLIVPPLPEEGSMDHVLATELAWAVATAGYPELRFNFRGVGASQGNRGQEPQRRMDVRAAMRVLRENAGESRVVVVTLNSSAALGVKLARGPARLAGVALVNPRSVDWSAVEAVKAPLLVVVPEVFEDRKAASAAVTKAEGCFEIIAGADTQFNRGLPQVGRSVVQWLNSLESVS